MKRWLIVVIGCLAAVLLATCAFMIAWLVNPVFRAWIGLTVNDGKDIIPSLPALVQLGSFALLAVAGFLCLLFRKRYGFVFHGFKNASVVPDIEKRPIDIDILAQEELVRQLKYLYRSLEKYKNGEDDDEGFNADALIKEPPFVNQDMQPEEEPEPLLDLAQFLPHGEAENIIVELKQLIKSFQSGKESEDLLKMIGESAPDDIAPFMKIIDAVTPRRIIEVAGHLQWQGETLEPRKVGITLECAGSDETTTRTIWWRHPNNKAASTVNEVVAGGTKQSSPADMVEVTDHYIELLPPAMCWLALTLWEDNYELRHQHMTKHRKAKLHYLLGALYYAYSQARFPQYGDFFWERAVEHLDQATKLDPNWCSPDLYVAIIYSNRLQQVLKNAPHQDASRFGKLLQSVLQMYNDFLRRTEIAEKRLRTQILLWPWSSTVIRVPFLPYLLYIRERKRVLLIRRQLKVDRALIVLLFLSSIKSLQVDAALAHKKIQNMIDIDVIDMVQTALRGTMQKVGFPAVKTEEIDYLSEVLQKNGLINIERDKNGHIKVKPDASLIRAMSPEMRVEAMKESMDQAIIEKFKAMLALLNDQAEKERGMDSTYLYSLACLDYLALDKGITVDDKIAKRFLRRSLLHSPALWNAVEESAEFLQGHENLEALKEEVKGLSK